MRRRRFAVLPSAMAIVMFLAFFAHVQNSLSKPFRGITATGAGISGTYQNIQLYTMCKDGHPGDKMLISQ